KPCLEANNDDAKPDANSNVNTTAALECNLSHRHSLCALLSAMLSPPLTAPLNADAGALGAAAHTGSHIRAQAKVLRSQKLGKNAAVIYLHQQRPSQLPLNPAQLNQAQLNQAPHPSQHLNQHPSQIVTCDAKGESALFFALPQLPSNGYEIFHQLDSSPQREVAQKFKRLFPEDYGKLLSLTLPGRRDDLDSLWAIAAILIGLNKDSATQSAYCLSDALMAAAMAYQGSNAPRIDYPLTKGEAYRSLNWCKTLGTVLSFRIAGNEDPSQLAFAMHDSLADYLANWLEHLDLNLGIQQIALAGNGWSNDTLAQRVSLRLGKNFPLVVNRHLALDGDNLAVGALYAKGRRWEFEG
ncbi:MAG: hypothetical protein ACRDA8_19495, partial [Shewanella sp.]